MDCEFCSVTAFNGRQYRQRPVEDVLEELESIPQKRIFFVDDNIIGYGKKSAERAVSLFKGMVEQNIAKEWFCQASMNFADNKEVLEYAGQSGCKIVFLGVEAEDAGALQDVNKQLNISVQDSYEETFRRINQYGIAVLGAFIYGMDSDTPESIRRRTDYILKTVDVMQTTFLTPLPGTRLFDTLQKEDRLLYTDFPADWDHYDMTEVVHQPGLMTPVELQEAMTKSVNRLYSQKTLYRKFVKTWWSTRRFTTAMWAYTSNKNYRTVALSQY